jgi:cobalt-precorrin-6B (C15)-methyltransferase
MDRGNGMIKDQDFIKNPNVPGPTKEEVRCIVICKSNIKPEDVVVDIGCGTGGLTLEFAKRAKSVYSIDINHDAIETTQQNLIKHGLTKNVEVIEGDGFEVLDKIEKFDLLVIGGSGGKLPVLIEKGYNKLNNNGRIIVTAILLETCTEAISSLEKLSLKPDVVNVTISKGEITKRGTMMLARNPITIISAKKVIQ